MYRWRPWLVVALAGGWGLLLPGCGGRPPAPLVPQKTEKAGSEDLLKTARELLHQADNLSHFRDALHLVNSALERVPERPAFRLPQEQRDQLVAQLGLEDSELAEIEDASFRPLDAHYLDSCFLLREVAQALEIRELPPLAQAEACFAWAMRHVALFDSQEDLLPPRYLLQRGLGNSLDRGLLFLALAHQLNLDGCLVTVPELATRPPRCWMGVLIDKDEETEVYLFDPRLGRPVPGPGNHGIATLDQVRCQPDLLLAEKSLDKDALRLEIRPACSLTALAPRMKYLENILALQDPVKLAVEQSTIKRLRAAGGSQLGLGKAEGQEGAGRDPVRALRHFLPPEEGGIDQGQRYLTFKTRLIPYLALMRNFSQLKLSRNDHLAAPAHDFLMRSAEELFTRFALIPRDFLTRGQCEQAGKRLVQIRTVLDDLEFAVDVNDPGFHRRVAAWREEINKAHLAAARQESQAKNQLQVLLYEDQFLFNLTQGADELGQGKFTKKMPTFIVGTAVKELLGQKVQYLLAMCWQERAERLEALAAGLKSGTGDQDSDRQQAAKTAKAAWKNTAKNWNHFIERHGLTSKRLDQRLTQIAASDVGSSFELWQSLLEDCQVTLHASLLLARAQEHAGSIKPARATLKNLAAEIDLLTQHPGFRSGLAAYLEKNRPLFRPQWLAQLDRMLHQFGPQGTFAALKETAAWRWTTSKN